MTNSVCLLKTGGILATLLLALCVGLLQWGATPAFAQEDTAEIDRVLAQSAEVVAAQTAAQQQAWLDLLISRRLAPSARIAASDEAWQQFRSEYTAQAAQLKAGERLSAQGIQAWLDQTAQLELVAINQLALDYHETMRKVYGDDQAKIARAMEALLVVQQAWEAHDYGPEHHRQVMLWLRRALRQWEQHGLAATLPEQPTLLAIERSRTSDPQSVDETLATIEPPAVPEFSTDRPDTAALPEVGMSAATISQKPSAVHNETHMPAAEPNPAMVSTVPEDSPSRSQFEQKPKVASRSTPSEVIVSDLAAQQADLPLQERPTGGLKLPELEPIGLKLPAPGLSEVARQSQADSTDALSKQLKKQTLTKQTLQETPTEFSDPQVRAMELPRERAEIASLAVLEPDAPEAEVMLAPSRLPVELPLAELPLTELPVAELPLAELSMPAGPVESGSEAPAPLSWANNNQKVSAIQEPVAPAESPAGSLVKKNFPATGQSVEPAKLPVTTQALAKRGLAHATEVKHTRSEVAASEAVHRIDTRQVQALTESYNTHLRGLELKVFEARTQWTGRELAKVLIELEDLLGRRADLEPFHHLASQSVALPEILSPNRLLVELEDLAKQSQQQAIGDPFSPNPQYDIDEVILLQEVYRRVHRLLQTHDSAEPVALKP